MIKVFDDNGAAKPETVAAVVVSYNRKVLLKECVNALLNLRCDYLKVLIVDNCSTDGTEEYIGDLISDKVVYFNTGENIGGAGGFNFGVKKAMELNADYIWLMDDDCIVQENSLSALLDFAKSKNGEFGFLSSKALWTDGTISKMNIQRRSIGDKKLNTDISGQKIRLASFVSLFLNRKAVEELGLPHKEFFIWGDDWEYTYRLSKVFDCYYVAESVVVHKSKSNMGVDISSDTEDRLDRYFYSYRNERLFYRKVGITGRLYYFLKIIFHIVKIIFSKNKNKKKRLRILFKGVSAGRSFKPNIEYYGE